MPLMIAGVKQKAARAKADSLLKVMGWPTGGHRPAGADVWREQQRVAIARALAAHPRLLLADEPTAALDSRSGRDVVDLLKGLAREQGCAVLLVTHDPRILDVADRLVEMEDGRLRLSPSSAPLVALA